MPVTIPVVPTVATAGFELLQTPPGAASVRVVVLAAHTVVAPDMVPASGAGFTVTSIVAADDPQLLVTV